MCIKSPLQIKEEGIGAHCNEAKLSTHDKTVKLSPTQSIVSDTDNRARHRHHRAFRTYACVDAGWVLHVLEKGI